MATTIEPEALYFGAPPTLTIDGVEVGGILENPKIGFEIEKYDPTFRNAGGPVKGTGRIKRVTPTLELVMNELSAVKIAHMMPGAEATVGTAADTVGGLATDLDGDVVAGAPAIKLDSVAGIAAGAFLKIGGVGETEIHKVREIIGTVVVLWDPLLRAHADEDAVVQVDDAGTTIFSWTTGPIPDAAYVDVEAIGEGVDGRVLRILIKNAIAGDSSSFDMGDDQYYGVPLKFTGHYDKDHPRDVPYELEIG